MDLKDFVSETLKEIISGVEEAQEYAKKHGAVINPTKFGIVAPKAIRISEELSNYIKNGKFNANALPNGYRRMGV